MNIVIDIGNTLTKLEFFYNNNAIVSRKYKKIKLKYIQSLISQNNFDKIIEGVIISTVSYIPNDIVNFFSNKKYPFIFFNEHTPLPIKNLYKSPETLGKDRLAAAVAANFIYPNTYVLCIDMGTCIKYDFVNTKNEYLGGAISPGFDMRLKALNTFTEKLPLVKKKSINFLIGKNTEDSILSGVINGTSSEINSMITKYKNLYPDLKLILSGGDMKNFDNNLKISIFAISNIVNLGLNLILDFNKPIIN